MYLLKTLVGGLGLGCGEVVCVQISKSLLIWQEVAHKGIAPIIKEHNSSELPCRWPARGEGKQLPSPESHPPSPPTAIAQAACCLVFCGDTLILMILQRSFIGSRCGRLYSQIHVAEELKRDIFPSLKSIDSGALGD